MLSGLLRLDRTGHKAKPLTNWHCRQGCPVCFPLMCFVGKGRTLNWRSPSPRKPQTLKPASSQTETPSGKPQIPSLNPKHPETPKHKPLKPETYSLLNREPQLNSKAQTRKPRILNSEPFYPESQTPKLSTRVAIVRASLLVHCPGYRPVLASGLSGLLGGGSRKRQIYHPGASCVTPCGPGCVEQIPRW